VLHDLFEFRDQREIGTHFRSMKFDEWRGARDQHSAAIVKEILPENCARMRLAVRSVPGVLCGSDRL
jgi:hypothetical protein